jgi:alpha-ketoglutarate-dependent taurine dioxygenase
MEVVLSELNGPFGIEALEIDLATDPTARTRHALNRALVDHQILLFRNQHLDDTRIYQVASWFGKVRVLPGGYRGEERVPGVRHLTNLGLDGRPTGRHPDPFSREWHADGAWMQTPARATLLYALRVPDAGGETQFADMYGGLEAFNESERRRLEQLEVIHDVELSRLLRYGRAVNLSRQQRLQLWLRFLRRFLHRRATVHPVIRTCPDTGRPAIVLGCDAWKIRGMGWRRGMREVAELTRRSIRHELILTHRWYPGDLLVWDNRSLLHRLTDYDLDSDARVMRQVVLVEQTDH